MVAEADEGIGIGTKQVTISLVPCCDGFSNQSSGTGHDGLDIHTTPGHSVEAKIHNTHGRFQRTAQPLPRPGRSGGNTRLPSGFRDIVIVGWG